MATTLGEAYVQIIPSARGIGGSIANALKGESASAGRLSGMMIGSKLKGALVASGLGVAIGSFFKAALSEGGQLQQSIGGVETLFKNNASAVEKYADQAYRTAGLSANAYMENVTSFSASLLQSVGGNTAKAAKQANMAMVDMADNSNKMGTSMESIQYAYQGFAKQNYTMLDNLKLGYGGTKSEMQRLLSDAQKLTGQKYDMSNLNDVYSAIHAIQGKLGITGTTAKEAASTLQGSFASMKSAAQNVLGKLALGEHIGPSLSALAKTTSTFLFNNFLPMIGNVVKAMPGALIVFVQSAVPQIISGLGNIAISIVNGIKANGPAIVAKIVDFFNQIKKTILNMKTSDIAKKGVEIIKHLASGIVKSMPAILAAMGKISLALIKALVPLAAKLLVVGIQLMGRLALGILSGVGRAIAAAARAIGRIILAFVHGIVGVASIGFDIVRGIWKGISSGYSWIIARIKSWVGNVVDFFKKILHIGSPSKVFEKEVGRWIPEGIAKGILGNVGVVKSAMSSIAGDTVSAFGSPLALAAGMPGTSGYTPAMSNSIVSGIGTVMQAGQSGDIHITTYLYPNGPKMGEQTVRTYDTYKRRQG